ncbi:hypothetical protein AZE42_05649 [Rhizopogon vesiculosus]|uniref:F-box domain-containing protein n=1 Tax=Rhizopogon vesiculosus TaxID=180088 RepID=A0A1J8Q4Y5_9AGAM|nr:hypothetical protein AZE42_05649 [Rhizopogon vesiculosus]
MRALRSRRNSLACISYLPPEILATIFEHVVERKSSMGVCRHPPCLTVTHVCTHWRRLALEYPSLWATIDQDSARWMGIMLERSKKVALVVTCNASIVGRDCFEQIFSQLPRIKVLRLWSYQSDVDLILDSLSSQPAPLLQIFTFTIIGEPVPQKFLSDAIFQGQAPLLRSLELTSCSFSWTCVFSGLRTLYVQGIHNPSACTLPELLQALRCMPDLERLTLSRLSMISGESRVLFDRVPLTQLKSIVLWATIQTAVALFAHLALPDNAMIALNLKKVQGHQSFSDLFSAIGKGPGKFGPVFRSLCAHLTYNWSVVQFSRSMEMECKSLSPSRWNPCDDDVRLSIQFHWDWDAYIRIPPSIIFDICGMVTEGSTIHSLCVSSVDNLQEHFWRTGSAALPALAEIHVNSSIMGLLAALRVEGVQIADVAYPSLRVLDLQDIDFQENEPDDLHKVVGIRDELYPSLSKLRIVDCRGIMADQVELFKDVTDVDWDGIEAVAEESEYDSESYYSSCHCPVCGD